MKLVRLTWEHPKDVPGDNYRFWIRADRVADIATTYAPAKPGPYGFPERVKTVLVDVAGKCWPIMESAEVAAEAVNQALGGGVNEAKRGSD